MQKSDFLESMSSKGALWEEATLFYAFFFLGALASEPAGLPTSFSS